MFTVSCLLAPDWEADHCHPIPDVWQLAKHGKRGILPEHRVVNCKDSQVAVAPHGHNPRLEPAVICAPLELHLRRQGGKNGRGQ